MMKTKKKDKLKAEIESKFFEIIKPKMKKQQPKKTNKRTKNEKMRPIIKQLCYPKLIIDLLYFQIK